MTIRKRFAFLSTIIATTAIGYAAPASAQATRTWVSGVGDDANPCSRTAPCKTFAGAISKTAAGGEINCIDPGAYGAVTITKAIAILCQYVEAGVLASGTNGITVNAGANDAVFLKGIDIHGGGSGLNGVRFLAGGSLIIQDSTIRAFNANNGVGVLFAPSGASQLTIVGTLIASNGNGTTGGGILVQPTGTGTAAVLLSNVEVLNNANTGFKVDTTGNTGSGITVTIENSRFAGTTAGITAVTPASTTSARVMVQGSAVANNTVGILGFGGTATLRVGNTTITGNGTGVSASGGAAVNTYGDNRLDGNGTDGAFTTLILKK